MSLFNILIFLKIFCIAIMLLAVLATPFFLIIYLLKDLKNSKKEVEATLNLCDAQAELRNYFFGSCEKCPKKLKELEKKEKEAYEEFLKRHPFLKNNKSTH